MTGGLFERQAIKIMQPHFFAKNRCILIEVRNFQACADTPNFFFIEQFGTIQRAIHLFLDSLVNFGFDAVIP